MRFRLPGLATLLGASATALALASPAIAAPLRVQINSDMRTSTPGVSAADGISNGIHLHIVEGLMAFGEAGDVKPLLAESVSVSPDGKTYSFQLRDGLRFHNGAAVTADDVKWSWDYFMGHGDWRCRREFDGSGIAKVEQVTIPDSRTIVYRLDRPNAMFLAILARPDCAMAPVIHRSSLNPDGTWSKPVGTGPFRFLEWKRGEMVRLGRFENYANRGGPIDGYTGGKRPLVDEVQFTVVPDNATAIAALKTGNLDIIPYLSPSEFSGLKDDRTLQISRAPNMGMVTLLMQTQDPLLQDVRMRHAIAAAVDTEELALAASDGLAKRNNSIVPSTSSYHTTAHDEGYRFDPALARKLATEAGYKGEELVIQTNQRFPWSYNVAIVSQAMLQAAGFKVRLEVLEWTTQLDRYWKGNYQFSAFPYSAQLDPAFSYQNIIGDKTRLPQKIWDDDHARDLNQRTMETSDRASRQALFDALHRRFLSEVPMLMLYNNIDLGVSRQGVEGYRSWQARPRVWEVTIDR